MFISDKAFFEDNTASNVLLIKQAETALPQEFVRLFKKNVRDLTPKKTAWLRRSIITQAIGTRAQIGWRASYAAVQEAGGRQGADGWIPFKDYTTGGTGPHFARDAFRATATQMPEVIRQLGLTK